MTDKTAIEFLFFSYFNIDIAIVNEKENESGEMLNDLLTAAINRAYRDASSHVLQFKFKSGLKEGNEIKIKNAYKNKCINLILNIINEPSIKEEWLEELADKMIAVYSLDHDKLGEELSSQLPEYKKDDGKFTFGIAQKWINMTIKNIYVMDSIIKVYTEKDSSCLKKLCDKFSDNLIDIPVDDFIIKAASKGYKMPVPIWDNEKEKKYAGNNNKYSKKLAWSNWKKENDNEEKDKTYYRAFQNRLKKILRDEKPNESLLDSENRLWIDAATGKYDK